MEFLNQAVEYVKALEEKIARLEKENAAKDQEIRRLSISAGKPVAEVAPAAPATETAPAEVAPAAPATETAPAEEAASQKKEAVAPTEKAPMTGFIRITMPKYKAPSQEAKDSLQVYEDDPALGQKAPSMGSLKWFNGEPVELGKGMPVVFTFFSKLNKGDFGTLSLLSEIAQEFKGQVQFAGVSRDGEVEDVSKFTSKYHGKFFDELQSPDGKPGLTVYMDFPLAFDESGNFNTQLKQVMKKGTVGVGMTVLVDGEGIIRWYEQFVRGFNVMGQLQLQIRNMLEGEAFISNGPAPEIQVMEEAVDLPDDVDPFAKTGKY